MKTFSTFVIVFLLIYCFSTDSFSQSSPNDTSPKVGEIIDSLNSVYVYYNDNVGTVVGRNVKNGYNIGLKYQCVEFVKRYYYEFYNHKMPDSYGHALSYYSLRFQDGQLNSQRNLLQYTNPSKSKPKKGDVIVMEATQINPYGHVAIISQVKENEIEIIQQNPGPNEPAREHLRLKLINNSIWEVKSNSITKPNQGKVLGWLRIQEE